jgi:RNA polymerase sigma-70 factor (sigma-E family)
VPRPDHPPEEPAPAPGGDRPSSTVSTAAGAHGRPATEPDGAPEDVTGREVRSNRQDGRRATAAADGAACLSMPDTVEPFEEFMKRERKLVVALLYGLTGDWYAAEDLAQDAFVAAQTRWSRVGHLDKPGAWVRRVAVNGYRRWRRRRLHEARLLAQQAPLAGDEQVELATEHAELWDAIRRLPRGQSEVVVLRFQSDLSEAAIADILEIPQGTVKSRLHYACKTLAKWLGDDVEGGS